MIFRRRIVLAVAAVLPLAAHAACSATNGDAIPNQAFDASTLDVGSNPDDPEAGDLDGGSKKDVANDAPGDAKKDAPNTAPVVINEIYVDQVLDGDQAEFVELRVAAGTPVDDLKIRIVYPNGQVKYEINVGLPGQVVTPSGLWVVSGNRLDRLNVSAKSDREFSISDPWGLEIPGAIQVVRGNTLLDVVGFTDAPDGGALPPLTQPPTATVEKSPVFVPTSPSGNGTKRHTIGRRVVAPGGAGAPDTNDNAADFCPMEASPGYPQKPCK